ncbi:MAG: hypothetical protein E4H10_02355 [Bacteroidia bacterium]|nr:MAG: hypothetical protein E4H10_02355 [Bacteroidia bacterium]
MRKLFIIAALLLFAGLAFGQTLQKGNLIGVHVITVDLKPGATLDQYIDFFNEKGKPAWENADKGMKVFLIKGLRGENVNEFGMIVQFKDEAARNKFYNADESLTELGIKRQEELAPIMSEWEKIGTYTSTYTDWLVL